jgi:hypothetical protein
MKLCTGMGICYNLYTINKYTYFVKKNVYILKFTLKIIANINFKKYIKNSPYTRDKIKYQDNIKCLEARYSFI